MCIRDSPRGVQRPGPAGQRLGEEPGVVGGEVGPLPGDVVLVEDGLDRADRLAGAAVDALVRLDVERSLPFVDAVDRALLDAGPVDCIYEGERALYIQPDECVD